MGRVRVLLVAFAAAVAGVAGLTVLGASASAQCTPIIDPTCATTTTLDVTTTEFVTTTTDEVTTTTRHTTTTAGAATTAAPTSTTTPLLLVPGPSPEEGGATTTTSLVSTAPVADSDKTGTVVALVITALAILALLASVLTWFYWRNTTPPRRNAGRAAPATVGGDGRALDVEAMIQRFRDRASAVKNRQLPPVAGEERAKFVRQAQIDFQDFAILADAKGTLEDGILVLRVDLRPPDAKAD